MGLSYTEARELRARHPAWRLLMRDHAPLILSFLQRTYIEQSRRVLSAEEFTRLLDDELFAIREREHEAVLPKSGKDYLADWVTEGVLRRTWAKSGDQEEIDLTPQTEKAIHWLASLEERSFVGTASRLLTFVSLLRQMVEESDPDAEKRVVLLERQRALMDEKIERARRGEVEVLSEAALRDRFQQADQLARGLLADFREVEENFRKLSRDAREQMTLWDGSKGRLLDEVWQSRDAIRDSDEGRSFEAFCDFLLSSVNREALAETLTAALSLPAVRQQARHVRLDRVQDDWIAAGEATQQTIALLSEQLRRFLNDRTLLENRRIMEILRNIEAHAIALRNDPPAGAVAEVDSLRCDFDLFMDKQMYRPSVKLAIVDKDLEEGVAAEGADALYAQSIVNRTALASHVASTLLEHRSVTLRDLTDLQPLSQGLAKLVTYLDLGTSRFQAELLDFMQDRITWRCEEDEDSVLEREATMQRLLFQAKAS